MTFRITQQMLRGFLLGAFLIDCGGGYQAPISEQSERLINNPPIIVANGNSDASFPLVQNKPIIVKENSNGSILGNTALTRAAPVNSRAHSNSGSLQTHRVRSGDNLMSIAFQYDLDFRTLARANGLNPPYTIFIDQEINLDVNRLVNIGAERSSRLGTAVSNNSIARSNGTISRRGGLIQQAIGSGAEPDWQWPHAGEILRGFEGELNKGIDIGGKFGDPVYAASAGDVVYSGSGVQGSSNLIIIRHSDKYLSAYAHNSLMLVAEGSRVSAGEKIAEVGRNASGLAMLHFEIRVDGKSVNPANILPNR